MSERKFSEKEIEEMREDVEKARLFRDFITTPIWKKHLEPFLYKLQQDAEIEALTSFRNSKTSDEVILRGGVSSGRAQAAEEFAKFIIHGIGDAAQSEKRLKEIEDAKKKDGGPQVTKKILLVALLALGLIPTRAAAIDWKHQEDIGIESTWAICISSNAAGGKLCGSNTSSQTSVGISSWTIPGWIIDYQVQTVGGNAQFNVQTSTDNWYLGGSALQGNDVTSFDFYTSSTIFVAPTAPCNTDVKGQIYNTKLNLTALDSGASVYIKVEYLYPRQRGQP